MLLATLKYMEKVKAVSARVRSPKLYVGTQVCVLSAHALVQFRSVGYVCIHLEVGC